MSSLETRVDEKLGNVLPTLENRLNESLRDIPKTELITAKLDKLQVDFNLALSEIEDAIPDYDEDVLFARLDALKAEIPDMVGTHVSMAIKGVQASEAKAMQAQLSAMGIEGVLDESKQAILNQIPASRRMAQQFMNKKLVSKVYSEEHPMETTLLELGRIGLASLLEKQEEGALGILAGDVGGNGGSPSGSYRPGIRRG